MSRRTFLSDPAVPEKPDAPQEPTARPRRDQILRTGGAWLGFSGLYALTAGTCPLCGQTSCPGGALTAGIVGGSLAFGLQAWRKLQK